MSIHWAKLDTAGKIDAIRSVHVPGMSASKIAEHFEGATRNAVIGIYGRHGAKLMDVPLSGIGMTRRQASRKRAGVDAAKPRKPKLVFRAPAQMPVGKPHNVSLMGLEREHCRWPVAGEGEHTLFCGHPKKPGDVSYCPGHRRLSCGPGTESERVAHKVLIKQAA